MAYDPKTKTLAVDNSWSADKDHLGVSGRLPRIPVKKLFDSANRPEDKTKK